MQNFGKLVLTLPSGQEQEFALGKPKVTIGRAAIHDIVLRDAKVSRSHAILEYGDAGCTLVDLGSTNGTCVNGVPIERAVLAPGDVITIGDSRLRFETAAPRIEPDVTLVLDSEADLETALTQEILPMTLTDTHVSSLAVHIPGKTWEIQLTQDLVTIGRQSGNDVVLDYPTVSRHHARLERRGEAFVIHDLHSRNGTWLGGQRIEQHVLRDGDTVCIGPAQLVYKHGFDPGELTLFEDVLPGRRLPRRPVVIVPGFMGSELWLGSERLWPNVRNLITRPEVFHYPGDKPLEARGPVAEEVIVPYLIKFEHYSRLGDYLEEGLGYERGKDLLEFGYDWRQDARLSAQCLAEAIEHWPVTPPITIIAHSLGCLVSRYYVEHLGGKKKVGRLLLVGGPHLGIPKTLTAFPLGSILSPWGALADRVRHYIATFPSVYQMLPTYAFAVDQHGREIDVLADETWLPEAYRPLLRAARDFRRELGTRCSVPSVSIFGYGLKTVTRVVVRRDAQGHWQKLDLTAEPSGDSSIPEVSAVLEGSEIHPVQQYHGALYVDNDVKMRLKLELTKT